jgi:YfiH family protein
VWCSSRAHGNVGDHVGDDPAVVASNRAALAAATGLVDPNTWVWLRQVHGTAVHVVARRAPAPAQPPEADAAVTALSGVALAVVTADCAPVVLASDTVIGVVHAGYRGLAAGVIEATIASIRAAGSGPVRAFLGPCIRAPHYEFGRDDLARMVAQFGPTAEGRTAEGRPALDIPAAIRTVLERCGVTAFDDCGRDTAGDEYFSYRARSDAGRQATIAMLQ